MECEDEATKINVDRALAKLRKLHKKLQTNSLSKRIACIYDHNSRRIDLRTTENKAAVTAGERGLPAGATEAERCKDMLAYGVYKQSAIPVLLFT